MSELGFLSWLDASAQIQSGDLSPVDYTRALLERIDSYDKNLDAFLLVTADTALAEARAAEQRIARGEARGLLEGIPFAIKDIIDADGLPTTAHSKILMSNIAKADATVTTRLRGAGGILLGKLSTHEFAIGGPCFDLPWPPARNPWNRDHFTGGSSSGSGAALAAGMIPVALGSDTGGSVRNPASNCGIVGMKPTYGRVSRVGVVPLAYSLDTIGPMTRTVRENAHLLNIIAGHDPCDPASAEVEGEDFSADLDGGVDGATLGVIRHFHTRDLEADPDVSRALEDALGVLTSLGAEVREIETHPLREFADCNRIILESEAYAIHEHWLKTRPMDYAALTRERLLVGAFHRAVDYVQATRMRRKLTADVEQAMHGLDAIVVVSSLDPPCRIDDPDAIAKSYARQARTPFNVTGQPSIAIPCGFTDAGLPLSIQIAGRPFDEATVYRIAQAYEQATDWKDRHPTLKT